MKKISTTIKAIYLNQKIEQQKKEGFFYEYKPDTPFWRKRLELFMELTRFGKCDKPITEMNLLCGQVSHKADVYNVRKVETPKEHLESGVVSTNLSYRITGIFQEPLNNCLIDESRERE